MQTARVRFILWSITGSAAAVSILIIGAAVMWPMGQSGESPAAGLSSKPVAIAADRAPNTQPLESFEKAWKLPLRRPLIDPPVASVNTATSAPATPAELGVRLVGTIVDGQHPRGLFMVGLTSIQLKGVGERVGSAQIVAIDDNHATLLFDGNTITLDREKNPFDPSGESYEPTTPVSDGKTGSD